MSENRWELMKKYTSHCGNFSRDNGNFVQFRVIGRSYDERMIPMLEIGKG